MIFVANFMYFHLLFTEIKNFDPLGHKWSKRGAGSGSFGVDFERFFMIFGHLIPLKRVKKFKFLKFPNNVF